MALVPEKAVQAVAVSATKESDKKRQAAPDWSDLVSAFGSQGLERDASGNIKGYRYPKPKDDDDRKRINNKVYELWNPQRKIATDLGGERNARIETALLKNPETGEVQRVPATLAERKARKGRLVEAPYYGRRQRDFTVGHVMLRNGELMRYCGEGRWEGTD